ncbi:MAG TPA: FliA/WhiG family RNA polymerase sigma factor [Phycisphaerae bacterium]|nr:FliA/WhiG family RNA polymerase sigma factor [Phycisphaerae bacterium]
MWSTYWKDRSEAARNALMEHYFKLVRFAAARLYQRRGRRVEIDDLVQYGAFGLKDAINSFDPGRGVKFETYCSTRIRGAMLDGLKSQQWLSRDQRQKITRFAEAHQSLLMETGIPPEDEEVAGRIGVCPKTIRRLERETIGASPLSLFTPCREIGEGHEADHAETLVDHREEATVDQLQREDVKAFFLRELARNERLILMLYYYEEMTMREIGETLGISGTRVSQMHSEIIQRLRQRLGRRMIERDGRLHISLDI